MAVDLAHVVVEGELGFGELSDLWGVGDAIGGGHVEYVIFIAPCGFIGVTIAEIEYHGAIFVEGE